MAELHLMLTAEEHTFLADLLESALKKALLEEHRTRTPLFRAHVLHNEELINSLLKKLSEQPVGS